MAITAYVGTSGSGKTYEVVVNVILPALRSGRRVVANIRGLHYDEMRAFLLEEGIPAAQIGEVVSYQRDQLNAPGFFMTDAQQQAFLRGGDLLIIDECWSFALPGSKIPADLFEFFRMHRQYVNAAGVSCDVVLISQSMQDIDRKVKVNIEKYFSMSKLLTLGMKKQYAVDTFQGYRLSKVDRARRLLRRYNPKFYPFYSSYAGKGGDEREVDGRLNILKSPFFLVGMPLAFVVFVVGLWAAYRLIFVGKLGTDKKGDAPVSAAVGSSPVGAPGGPLAAVSGGDWRAAGFYNVNGRFVAVLDQGGRIRFYASPVNYVLTGSDFQVQIDGKFATAYSGSPAGARQQSVLGR